MATILVLDGNELNRELVSLRLRRRGYEVLVAERADEGIAMVSDLLPDLVLMDTHFPGLDSFEAARKLKGEGSTGNIPFVALSSGVLQGDRVRAAEAGFDASFSRPLDFPALLAKIGELLSRSGHDLPGARSIPESRPRPPGVGARILVVDDEENNRDLLARRLAKRGFDVHAAASGKEALARLIDQRFDMVLLDVMMPGMSGMNVLKRIREVHAPLQLPVIMVTARSQAEDVASALDAGANDYVTKPLDFTVVLARIQTHLSLRAATDGLRCSEHRFRMLAEQSAELVSRQTPDGRWLYVSPSSRTLLGYEPEDLVGRSSYELVHPDDFGDLGQRLALDDNSPEVFTLSARLRKRDGSHAWFETAYRVLRDPHTGEVVELQASYRDVSGQVRAQVASMDTMLHHLARKTDHSRHGPSAVRVSHTVEILLLRLDLGQARADFARRASLLHDIGLLTVSRTLLERAGPLAPEELDLVREHTRAGFDLLTGSGDEMLELAAHISLNHHERWDGKGYPRARAARDTPMEARVVAIADTFDALTSARPWRDAHATDETVAEMSTGRGTQFDPQLFDAFLGIVDEVVALRASFPDPRS